MLTAGLGGMGGAQPLAGAMVGAAILCVEVDPHRIERRLETRYLDEATDSLDDALARVRAAAAEQRALSVGLLGNAADVVPELAARGEHFDLVTDQTAAHDPLNGLRPARATPSRRRRRCARPIRTSTCAAPASRSSPTWRGCSRTSGRRHVFDYGNNLRGEARDGRRHGGVRIPGLRPGVHPAAVLPRERAVPLGGAVGRSGRHRGDRRRAAALFPDDAILQRWLELAPERVAFQGLPARICWLGYGDRARAGLAINELVRRAVSGRRS